MTAKTPIKPVKSNIDLTTIRIRAVEIATETIVQTVGTAIEEAASEALKSAIELVDPEDAEYRANIADALEALAKSIRGG
jgi:hypothetical protein